MEVTLNSKEINQALIHFVSNKMKINPDQKIQIEYKAGRGENGPTASIIIGEDDSETLITEVEEKVMIGNYVKLKVGGKREIKWRFSKIVDKILTKIVEESDSGAETTHIVECYVITNKNNEVTTLLDMNLIESIITMEEFLESSEK